MPSVTLVGVSLAFGARTLLESIGFTLPKGRKVALAGANGSGKSTLLRIIAGQQLPDAGSVARDRHSRIAYLPQAGWVGAEGPRVQNGLPAGRAQGSIPLYDEVERAFAAEAALEAEMRGLEEQLAGHREHSLELTRLLERHHQLQEALERSGYDRRRETIERVLQGLGFRREELEMPVGSFSQGWQMRIQLARVLCEGADFLLLDEPTNFLDLEARDWLESFLRETPAGVLLVSHDRYFLDTTAEAVAELYRGRLAQYPGSFSAYERRRLQELAQAEEAYERQQEEIARQEAFIRRFRYKASKARQVQSRVKTIERLTLLEPPPVRKVMHFSFPPPPHSGRLALSLEGVAKSYGAKTVFSHVSLELERGEKLVLVGANGAGKSTLMRLMAGREEASAGQLRYGSAVKTGYYSPEELERLNDSQSVLELVESWTPTQLQPSVRSLLGAFLFPGEDVHKPVAVLSGGEKNRLALLRLLLAPANLLFLDEPTNHLDLHSQDVLLEALRRYSGSLVFVSHDRLFIERLATRVLEIEGGRARLYPGDYAYYLWRKGREGEAGPEKGESPGGAEAAPPVQGRAQRQGSPPPGVRRQTQGVPEAEPPTDSSASAALRFRLDEKRQKRELRRLDREEEQLLAEMERLQAEQRQLERSLASEQVYRDGGQVKRIKGQLEQNRERQNLLTRRWEEVEEGRRLLEEG
jgi:ATP-binding cassette subfamily F protein 3